MRRKRMICTFMFIISNHYGIICLSYLLQFEPCNFMFKMISENGTLVWYEYTIVIAINFCNAKKMIWAFMLIISKHFWIICLSYLLQFEPCNFMFKMISENGTLVWYEYTIVIAINFCNAKKMIWAFMLIISKHFWIKSLSNLLYLEPCIVMFKVISDMSHWFDMWYNLMQWISAIQRMIWAFHYDHQQSWWNNMS